MGRIISLLKRLPAHFVPLEGLGLLFISTPDDLLFNSALSEYPKVQTLTAQSTKTSAKAALPLHVQSVDSLDRRGPEISLSHGHMHSPTHTPLL